MKFSQLTGSDYLQLMEKIAKKLIPALMPPPVEARHSEYSLLLSADDDLSQPSEYLLSIALEAIGNARRVSLDDVCARMRNPPYYPNIWLGEHYKLLAGLILTIRPTLVVEIGTGAGLSSLSMKRYLPEGGKIVTFDIIDWKTCLDTSLREEDFADGMIAQYVDDLSRPSGNRKYLNLLQEADMLFVDAAKDGIMDPGFDRPPTCTFVIPYRELRGGHSESRVGIQNRSVGAY